MIMLAGLWLHYHTKLLFSIYQGWRFATAMYMLCQVTVLHYINIVNLVEKRHPKRKPIQFNQEMVILSGQQW